MNEKTLVALYDDVAAAYRAVDELEEAGMARERIQVVSGAGDAVAKGEGFNAQTGAGAVEDSRGFGVPGTGPQALVDAGVPEQDAEVYAEAVRRGSSLLMAHLDAGQVDRALAVLARHRPADAGRGGRTYPEAGRAGLGKAASAMRDADAGAARPGPAPGEDKGAHPKVDPVAEERARRPDHDGGR